jgi:hypothetical protein
MTDAELIAELHFLGIDQKNARIVGLLPLTHVAWVDGRVQRGERDTIFAVARGESLLDPESVRMIDGWLANAPTEEYQRRGREVLRELARRGGGLGTGITPHKVESIVAYCQCVARAAGGLFGTLFVVSKAEQALIEEISSHLVVEADEPPSAGWDSLLDEDWTEKLVPQSE